MNYFQKIYYFIFFKLRKLFNPTGNPSIDRYVKLSGRKVKIGAFCYGFADTTILSYDNSIEISFGRYCSIASGLKIFTGGNHRPDWFSTFPFGHLFSNYIKVKAVEGTPKTNGNITIGNDVWIGRDVTIMSGITIGDGAIIAANSHIVKDVMPYSIVGGNPGKLIKFRFSNEVIEKLLKIQWWNYNQTQIEKIIPFLCFQESNDIEHNLNKLASIQANG